MYLTRFRTYKSARPPQIQKPRRGGGLRQINSCRKVLLQAHFFRWRHFAFAFYQSNHSTLLTKPSLSFPGLEETVTVELDVTALSSCRDDETASPVLETAVLFADETADMPAVVCPLLVDSVVLSVVVPSRRSEASVSGWPVWLW